MENNIIYKVSGIRTINLLLDNGNVLILKGTMYVPDLKRNLASLGMLDDMEFNINLGQGIIKILRG